MYKQYTAIIQIWCLTWGSSTLKCGYGKVTVDFFFFVFIDEVRWGLYSTLLHSASGCTGLCQARTVNLITYDYPMHSLWAWYASQAVCHDLLCHHPFKCCCWVNIFSLRHVRHKHLCDPEMGCAVTRHEITIIHWGLNQCELVVQLKFVDIILCVV